MIIMLVERTYNSILILKLKASRRRHRRGWQLKKLSVGAPKKSKAIYIPRTC